ncbi:hypothetical protein K461DRAFT_296637 [Myriangium duriaei CBS 260.36]|uniref:Pinin/SDK/MemA protein domain-containing protein n=1 Tax=Myriangium duriaei CBS 260.36 TaxID=1168546 RepID=A0A9P4MJY8_9PEZI|nr:hypothetical protein K461DRAFT_296637 [Myriangium duriaei CBS 260.36]
MAASPPPSPGAKRHASANLSPVSKRQRTSPPPQESGTSFPPPQESTTSSPPLSNQPKPSTEPNNPPSPSRPDAKKRTIDPKARTRRLFGSLLTPSTTTSSPAKNRGPSAPSASILSTRARIEARARERSDAAVPSHALSGLSKEDRRTRQRGVDRRDRRRVEEAVKLRGDGGWLVTEAEPRVLWRPWKLMGSQDEEVRRKSEKGEREVESLREGWRRDDRERERRGEREGEKRKDGKAEEREGEGHDDGGARNGSVEDRLGPGVDGAQDLDERERSGSGERSNGRSRSMSFDEGGDNAGDAEDTVVY